MGGAHVVFRQCVRSVRTLSHETRRSEALRLHFPEHRRENMPQPLWQKGVLDFRQEAPVADDLFFIHFPEKPFTLWFLIFRKSVACPDIYYCAKYFFFQFFAHVYVFSEFFILQVKVCYSGNYQKSPSSINAWENNAWLFYNYYTSSDYLIARNLKDVSEMF